MPAPWPTYFRIFPIAAPASRVFAAISTPAGLDQWWTLTSSGSPIEGSDYTLDFGPEYQRRTLRARAGVRVGAHQRDARLARHAGGFALEDLGGRTWVRFARTGWPDAGEHYRTSSHCWALYLRILRRLVEHGETVPYADRLNV